MPFIFGAEGPVKAKKVPIVKISSVSTEGDSPKTTASSSNPYESSSIKIREFAKGSKNNSVFAKGVISTN
jgi:hypothetical protein